MTISHSAMPAGSRAKAKDVSTQSPPNVDISLVKSPAVAAHLGKKTIMDYAGYLTNLDSGGDTARERLIQEVAIEYVKAKRDTILILRLLVGDYHSPQNILDDFLEVAEPKAFPYHISPTAVIEIVNILEKIYMVDRKAIADIIHAILDTPFFRCDMDEIFRKAIKAYVMRGAKFADAVMVHWGFWTETLPAFTDS
ncbi:MAG: hypothetical protein HZB29_07725 [Nitrospinae bacterium]|nr:hypothetical protein [Nitrospinota bacterium]